MNADRARRIFFLIGLTLIFITLTSCHKNTEYPIEKIVPVVTEEQDCFPSITNKENDVPMRIVGLGDSLTAGIGDEKDEGGYIGKLTKKLSSKECPVTLENYSVEGNKTTDLLQNISKDNVAEAIKEAHIIMFTIGANDLVTIARKERMQFTEKTLKKAEQQYAEQIEKILLNLKELNEEAHIYVIGFYNPISSAVINNKQIDLLITKWNNMSKQHTNKLEHTFFVRIDDLFSERMEDYLAEDHFHPNHLGYKKIAERLMKTIQARGE